MKKNISKKFQYSEIDDHQGPPGKRKIAAALNNLLEHKDFISITTAEISKASGVNESMIYRYFSDKRGLLHYILARYLKRTYTEIMDGLKHIEGSIEKLAQVIRRTLEIHDCNRVFAKILLIEVRNFPGYWESDSYRLVKQYAKLYTDIIEEGLAAGEIRTDIGKWHIMQTLLGTVENMILPCIIFQKPINVDNCMNAVDKLVLKGLSVKI